MDSPFHDTSALLSGWRDPNVVRGEEVLVAEMSGRIVGCVTVEDKGRELELVNIDVPLELQGRGIGTIVVQSVEERARAAGSRQSLLARAGTQKAWPGSHFPGGSTSDTGSPTKRRTHGPGQSGPASARYACGRTSRPNEITAREIIGSSLDVAGAVLESARALVPAGRPAGWRSFVRLGAPWCLMVRAG